MFQLIQRRGFIKKAVLGVAALGFAGFANTKNARANSAAEDAETQRRIDLARKHMEVEALEASTDKLFVETMGTLQQEPEYILNGAPLSGHDTILKTYQGFFGPLENVKFVERPNGMYVAKQAIIFEVSLTADVKGKPAAKIDLPMFVAFVFDQVGGPIVGEHAYFDSATFARQLGG
ncbi:hypothetical protein K2X30_14280 [bacterium]|jgi:hypothetical protein|nr:hypothetical protein [bacterium]